MKRDKEISFARGEWPSIDNATKSKRSLTSIFCRYQRLYLSSVIVIFFIAGLTSCQQQRNTFPQKKTTPIKQINQPKIVKKKDKRPATEKKLPEIIENTPAVEQTETIEEEPTPAAAEEEVVMAEKEIIKTNRFNSAIEYEPEEKREDLPTAPEIEEKEEKVANRQPPPVTQKDRDAILSASARASALGLPFNPFGSVDYWPKEHLLVDSLAANIAHFGEKNYIVRWNPKRLPLVFYLDHSIDQELAEHIQVVFDYLNQIAADDLGILAENKCRALVELAEEQIDASLEKNKKLPTISLLADNQHLDNKETAGSAKIERLADTGEILDADIEFYANVLYQYRHLNEQKHIAFIRYVIMHELLHALGIGHNQKGYLYNSVMTPACSNGYNYQLLEDPQGLIDHDRQILRYQYTKGYDGFSDFILERDQG